MLPKLITETHETKWIAFLEGVPGMVAQGDTKEDAIDELMVLIEIKLVYDMNA